MPITPKVEWSETIEGLSIQVHIKHVQKSKINITASALFLKVNYKPFILDLDLKHPIKYQDVLVRILPKYIEIKCEKAIEGIWKELRATGTKEDLKNRREKSLAEAEKASEEVRSKRKEEKRELQTKALHTHWKVQDKHKSAIETMKKQEIEKGFKDIENFAQQMNDKEEGREDEGKAQSPADLFQKGSGQGTSMINNNNNNGQKKTAEPSATKEIWASIPYSEKAINDANDDSKSSSSNCLPPVRQTKTIRVSFSKKSRKGMPLRGDHDAELAKIRRERKDTSGPLQEQAVFLKDKGDKFFKNGDYIAGINAYTAAINKDPEMVQCYSNRAGCYLMLFRTAVASDNRLMIHQLRSCRSDCSTAIDILNTVKHLELTDKQRQLCLLKCHIKRGQAYSELGDLKDAVADFLVAAQRMKGNKEIEIKIQRLGELLKNAEKSDSLKRSCQQALSKNNLIEAKKLLDLLVGISPLDPNLRVQRAHCLMKTGYFVESLWDSTMALATLDDRNQVDLDSEEETSMAESLKKVRNKQILRSRILSVRAGGYAALHKYEKAKDDYESALALVPTHPDLQKAVQDVKMLITARKLVKQSKELFAKHKYFKAANMLTTFLKKIPMPHLHISILCNRSACYLASREYDKCVADCTRALNFFHAFKEQPPPGSDIDFSQDDTPRTLGWLRTSHIRRGSALCWQGKLEDGLKDYLMALTLQKKIEKIQFVASQSEGEDTKDDDEGKRIDSSNQNGEDDFTYSKEVASIQQDIERIRAEINGSSADDGNDDITEIS
mmetsp:Transcript_10421/g.16824  ORF Transcript_10421/g.16824 Transcript_10421/m.16824 type:complete len:782 (-) Transcript_10421:139-2484(-)